MDRSWRKVVLVSCAAALGALPARSGRVGAVGGGVMLSIGEGERRTFAFTFEWSGDVDPLGLAAIALAQDPASLETLQAGTTLVP